jgi:hypothetical protein
VGEFSWGTFMRALAAEAQHAKAPRLADRDVAPWIGRMGLIEARAGSKAFSQMYAALALQHFGEDLARNAVWQTLSTGERDEWRALLDVNGSTTRSTGESSISRRTIWESRRGSGRSAIGSASLATGRRSTR